ncbi:hypothetical protein [Morganella morganii]|uniref:hypothetical protein n=1 Tax=Morganella morganii TaxID=582 RepID=UPI00351CEAE6
MMTNNRSAGEISPATEQDLTALIALDTVAAQEAQRCEAIRRRIEQKICFVLRREGKNCRLRRAALSLQKAVYGITS